MLRDIRENNDINIEEIDCEESLFDGGPDFNWNLYAGIYIFWSTQHSK